MNPRLLLVAALALTACQDRPGDVRRVAGPDAGITFTDFTPSSLGGSNVWHARYWDDWWQTVAVERDESAIDFDWGWGSPDASMGGDSFAVVWEGDFDFCASGTYWFTTESDDGICVYVDGQVVNCAWDDHAPLTLETSRYLEAGSHHVKVDYYENGGGAVARVSWRGENDACDQETPGEETPDEPTQGEPDPDPTGVLDSYVVRWSETFDGGKGDLSRAWGPGVDESVRGQLSMHSTPDDRDSGSMVPPTDRSAGFGYGLYSFTLSSNGKIGGYALVWPGTDVWPGPELDIFELTEDGIPYGTVHWKQPDGSNGYRSVLYWGVNPREVHTYSMLWEPGEIRFYVDGEQMGDTVYEHVPADAAHGGENECPGIGMQTWWNSGGQGSSITAYEVTYATRN